VRPRSSGVADPRRPPPRDTESGLDIRNVRTESGGSGRRANLRDTVVRGPRRSTTTGNWSAAHDVKALGAPAARARRRYCRSKFCASAVRTSCPSVSSLKMNPRHVGERTPVQAGRPLRWYRDTRTAWRPSAPVVQEPSVHEAVHTDTTTKNSHRFMATTSVAETGTMAVRGFVRRSAIAQ